MDGSVWAIKGSDFFWISENSPPKILLLLFSKKDEKFCSSFFQKRRKNFALLFLFIRSSLFLSCRSFLVCLDCSFFSNFICLNLLIFRFFLKLSYALLSDWYIKLPDFRKLIFLSRLMCLLITRPFNFSKLKLSDWIWFICLLLYGTKHVYTL